MRAFTSTVVRHSTTGTAAAAVLPIVASAPQHRHRRRAQQARARCAAAPSNSGGGGGLVYSINTDASTVAAPQQPSATTTSPLEPYIIVDRREILRARWDVREHSADEAARARARLESAGAESVEFGIVPGLAHAGAGSGSGGGGSVALTVACAADGGGLREALAAIILEETPALEVRFAVESRASLPVRSLSVPTPWGAVSVRVSLRGSEPHKASPHWPSCEQVAAAAAAAAGQGAAAPTATDVAEAALAKLRKGLADGSIVVSTPYHF
jgi:hypothetical protein